MDNQLYLSICIPTDGAVKWVLPVIDSIYSESVDNSLFEVVITDNGKNSDLPNYLSKYNYPNLRYIPKKEEGFLNLVASLKEGNGLFCKMQNHRNILLPGTISKWIELIKKYEDTQPIFYFADGNAKGDDVIECGDLDSFMQKLSYWASWSAGIGFWKKDIVNIDNLSLNNMFPNASLLFELRKSSKYVIFNQKYQIMGDETGKGGYDVFYTFCVSFLDILNELRCNGRITDKTFVLIKKDLFGFMTGVFQREVILPTKHTFILSDIKDSIAVYYGDNYYYLMCLWAFITLPITIFEHIRKKISNALC